MGALARRVDVETTEATPLWSRVHPLADGWEGLLYSFDLTRSLRAIVARWRNRELVHRVWGFQRRVGGEGLLCLFSGDSGSGKSAAANAVATELGLPLYRVNVAGLVSKYVGETEKNLAKILDRAEAEGAALLFDEADAVFARRSSEMKGSADLGHNQQVAYLLDRLERWNGLAFLTTNLGSVIDSAFRRRFHIILSFELPTSELRAQIWRLSLAAAPVADEIDFCRLAAVEVSGGVIQKAALNAAFAAADEKLPVGMRHLQLALEDEAALAGKLCTF